MILGGGPNRIGQGIEFDYCCCQAAFALKEAGYETIMVNSNPETVSTDYDTSDHLFFEPLTAEDVLNICDRMKPAGLIVQFGGQTPLNLARALADAGAPIIGTSVDSIDAAEDRKLFQELVDRLGLKQPANGTVRDLQQAIHVARRIGYPVLVRPSFVLGGRGMEIVYDEAGLNALRRAGHRAVAGQAAPDRQVPGVGRRGGRRLHQRRRAHGDRRRDAAHRGGGHPLRRLGLRDPAAQPAAGRGRRDPPADARAGPRAEGQGADERAIRRHAAWRAARADDLRPGSEPAAPAAPPRSCRRRRACRWRGWRRW